MRRFSQRGHLVTLSEINITPLLDLAFVLLIIFIITTPLLEKGFDITLPKSSSTADKPIVKSDIKTAETSPQGVFLMEKRRFNIDQLEAEIVRAYAANPQLVVFIRADEKGYNKDTYAVID